MNDIEVILGELRKFNQERDWDQFQQKLQSHKKQDTVGWIQSSIR